MADGATERVSGSGNFAVVQVAEVSLLVYRPWWEAGIVHGMTLRNTDFRDDRFYGAERVVGAAVGFSHLVVPEQEHGPECADLRTVSAEYVGGAVRRGGFRSDALLAPLAQPHQGLQVAYGVMTADCVPIVVRSVRGWGVIHAGWRGLACGVIGRAVEALGEVSEAAVFASAGGSAYEVGPEVVESIGATAVVAPAAAGGGKALLDTAHTARRQLEQIAPAAHVAVAGICTLSDQRFHSFRRDGAACGRAVTFVVPA